MTTSTEDRTDFVPPLPLDAPPSDDHDFSNNKAPLQETTPYEISNELNAASDRSRPRKRKSRWESEDKRVHLQPVKTVLPSSLSSTQLEQCLVQIRLEEINRKLKTGDVVPPDHERSPSPTPTYDNHGKRTNTREIRYRKKLEDERGRLIELMIKNNPTYKPPVDYKKVVKLTEKVWIPVNDYPEVNFIGLIIGPRGNELRKMERESGAKISIRGRGSIKENKFRSDPSIHEGADEELHAFITADSEEKLKTAINMVNHIIELAVQSPEEANVMKQQQLKELALLNGTLREDDILDVCSNCGATGHRKYDCPEARNFTINLICKICGAVGHLAMDCMNRSNPQMLKESRERQEKIANECASFISELSGRPVPASSFHSNDVKESLIHKEDNNGAQGQNIINSRKSLEDQPLSPPPKLSGASNAPAIPATANPTIVPAAALSLGTGPALPYLNNYLKNISPPSLPIQPPPPPPVVPGHPIIPASNNPYASFYTNYLNYPQGYIPPPPPQSMRHPGIYCSNQIPSYNTIPSTLLAPPPPIPPLPPTITSSTVPSQSSSLYTSPLVKESPPPLPPLPPSPYPSTAGNIEEDDEIPPPLPPGPPPPS